MKKLTALILAAFMAISSFVACAAEPATSATTSAETDYTAYLLENVADAPDTLVVGDADTALEHGIDMSDFEDEGFFTRATDGEVLIFGKTEAGIDRGVRDFVKYGNNDAYTKTYGEGYRVKRLTIAGNDISEYVIVYDSDDYNGNIKLAATELSAYIEKTCGATLSYYTDVEFAELEIKPTRTITLTVDYPALGNEAFRIEVADDGNMTIFGGRVSGCIYGVYDLLEENVGWRFFRDVHLGGDVSKGTMEYLYEAEHIDLTSEINRTEEPLFESRRMDNLYFHSGIYNTPGGDDRNYKFKKRIAEKWWSGHGLNDVDYTGTKYEGREGKEQPCLTDEDILAAIDAHIVKILEIHDSWGYIPGRDYFGISLGQYDGTNGYCYCQKCMKVAAEEGSGAGLYVRMANRAAQLLKDMGYGDIHINILAYCQTSVPPKKTMPLDNVRVSFCFYVVGDADVCTAHTLDGKNCVRTGSRQSSNKILAERFEAWSEICAPGSLDVWYYPFHDGNVIAAAPMVLNLYEDIKYLSSHGVTGIINTVLGGASQFTTLIEYLLNSMCWELPESYEEFLDMIYEWLWLTYGDAADPLYEYLMEYERLGKKADCYTPFYQNVTPMLYFIDVDMDARLDYFCGLFENARLLANTSDQVDRIEILEAGMLFLGVSMSYDAKYVNGTAEEREHIIEQYKRLHELCTKHNVWVVSNISSMLFGKGMTFAPAELDLDESPIMWYNKAVNLSPDSDLHG